MDQRNNISKQVPQVHNKWIPKIFGIRKPNIISFAVV